MRTPIFAALLSATLTAHDATAQAEVTGQVRPPATDVVVPVAVVALPAAGSPEATALLDKACAKMLALGRGTFSTSEEQDHPFMRGQNLPFGGEPVEVTGGWQGDMVWGSTGEDERFARKSGRLLVKAGSAWKLRGSRLASGAPAPFTLDPGTLFKLLQGLPAEARKVAHVEAGEAAKTQVVILTLSLEGDAAAEFAQSGALPDNRGGPMFALGGMPGGMPDKSYKVDLALFVDASNGDVHRLRAKVYEDDPMLANIRFQVGDGGGGGDVEVTAGGEDKDNKPEPAGKGDGQKVKKGLPDRAPSKTESVMYFKVDFKTLGQAEPPAFDDQAKAWLGLR